MALTTYSALPVGPGTGTNSANSDGAGTAEAESFAATRSGVISTVAMFIRAGSSVTSVRFAIYADSGAKPGARLGPEIVVASGSLVSGAWNYLSGLSAPVVSGTTYWVAWLPLGGTLNYSDNAASGGNVKDVTPSGGQATLTDPAFATWTSAFTNIVNVGVMGDDGAGGSVRQPILEMLVQGGYQRALAIQLLQPLAAPAGVTALSASDSGTGSETGTVSATVPGSDSSTGTEAGTVSATVPGSDASTGTDTGAVAATVPGADTGTGTDVGSPSVVVPGGDTGSGSEAGGVSATVTGSDSATGTDVGTVVDLSATQVSGSDSGAGSESGVVLDLTPPVIPAPAAGGGRELDYGDESDGSFRALSSSDGGMGIDWGTVERLEAPAERSEPLFTVRLPERRVRPAEPVYAPPVPAQTFFRISSGDSAHGVDVGKVESMVDDVDEMTVLGLLGVL